MLSYEDKVRLVDYHIESRFSRLTTPEGYDFAYMPKEHKPEAAWRYDNMRHRHNLILNENIDEMSERSLTAGSRGTRMEFAKRIYDHEGAHSLYTDRDNKKLDELREKAGIPFHLWNLLEDARIEARWRRDFGYRFDWLRFLKTVDEEPLPPALAMAKAAGAPMNAIKLFLDCTRMENSPRKLNKWVENDKDPLIAYEGKGKPKFGRRHLVRWYYRQAIRSTDTASLVRMVESWIKTFPETGDGGPEGAGACGSGVHGSDMALVGGGMPKGAMDADGSEHEEIESTCESMASESSMEIMPEIPVHRPDTTGESKIVEIPENSFFHKKAIRRIDTKRGDALINLFERFLEGGEGLVTSRNPSNRIDFNKFMRGADDIYIRKGDDPLGVKDISFIFDASGSMSGVASQGCYLAYVLNELVRRGRINCKNMILSGGNYYKLPMPFDPAMLNHLATPGGIEGFANTMRENEAELVNSDMTIFFTDGDITDEHISKDDWHRKGVYTIGLYVGQPEKSSSLHRWFDSVLVRNDIESIADSLVQLIKRQ